TEITSLRRRTYKGKEGGPPRSPREKIHPPAPKRPCATPREEKASSLLLYQAVYLVKERRELLNLIDNNHLIPVRLSLFYERGPSRELGKHLGAEKVIDLRLRQSMPYKIRLPDRAWPKEKK